MNMNDIDFDSSWLVCDAKHLEQMKRDLVAEETSNPEDPDLLAIVTPENRLFVFEDGENRATLFNHEKERRFLSSAREVLFCTAEKRDIWMKRASQRVITP